MICGNAP